MADFLVESDVLIDFLKGDDVARVALQSAAEEGMVMVCALSAAEVMAASTPENREVTRKALITFVIVPVDGEVALIAGKYRSDARGDNVELGDCVVAAMACQLGSVLLSGGRRNYPPGDFQVRKLV